MARAYSPDMRGRVIARVESGGSRREAAEYYDVSASTAVIWVKCFRETGRCAAKPRGGHGTKENRIIWRCQIGATAKIA
jgi:transposase